MREKMMSDRVKEMVQDFLKGKPMKDCRPADNEWRTSEEVEDLFRVYFKDLTKQLSEANKLIAAKIVEQKCIHCGQSERNRSALCPSRAGFGGDWHEWAALKGEGDEVRTIKTPGGSESN